MRPLVILSIVALTVALAQPEDELQPFRGTPEQPYAVEPSSNEHLKSYDPTAKDKAHSTWVMMEVSHDGSISVLAAKKTHQAPSGCRSRPSIPDDHVVVTYTHPETKEECAITQRDPRKMYYDHDLGAKPGKFKGGIHHHKKIHFSVNVHKDCDALHTFDHKNHHRESKKHFITEEHHRNFETMQAVTVDSSQIDATTLQHVGPTNQQKNFVFISSGYTDAEKGDFEADVQTLMTFVQLPDTQSLSSQPYRRYFSATNFYQVWYPSAESGASKPMSGVTVNNNLDCSYGDTNERILTCNRAKVELVGSYAPPAGSETIYMILVNDDNTFGGTGGAGVCTTYTGTDMKVIFIHEIGHAGADLADEYDYGYAETKQIAMKNCHYDTVNTPWDPWVYASIIPPPTQICTYSNYYKPTPSSCLMESNQPSYCPVCSATALEQMFDFGINLASPRYPGIYETVYVELGTASALYMNNKVPYHKDETGLFDVVWTVDGYPAYTATGDFRFHILPSANGSTGFVYPAAGTYTVSVTITDNTNMLLASTRDLLMNRHNNNATALKQISNFTVIVYDPAAGETNNGCVNKTTPYGTSYCAVCAPGEDCSTNVVGQPLESVIDIEGSLDGLAGWLIGIGGMFIALGVLIFILIWRMMALHAEHNPREILPLTFGITVIRIVLLGVQIFLLIGSTCSIIFSVYMYGQLSVFGRTLMLGVIASSVVVWFASFVGFCAAYYKNRAVLFVNFILLLLLFGCALLFTTLILYMLFNIDKQSVKEQLDGEWRTAVQQDPVQVCTLQKVLKCSGFNTSCVSVAYNTAGTSNCPSNCERSNLFGDPCFLRVRDFVRSKFATASIGGIILCVFILSAMILALVLGCSIKSHRNRVHKERRRRHQNGEPTLTAEEVALLRREFDKIDKDQSGDISRSEFALFYNAVMGVQLSPRELTDYFDKLDADGNGVLSFEEFVKVYVPQTETKKRSLAKTKSMIYQRTQQAEANATMGGTTGGPQYDNDEDDDGYGAQNNNGTLAKQGTMSGTVMSQKAMTQAKNLDLDVQMDEDMEVDLSPEEQARRDDERARTEASRVAQAQADRQKRTAEDRPSNIDADLVMDEDGAGNAGFGGTLDAGQQQNNVNLDIDLDNEEFE